MPKTAVRIGPDDNGRRMRLVDFENAEVQEGYLYELGRGLIVVSNVPKPFHLAQIHSLRIQLYAYLASHRDAIYRVASVSECKVLVWSLESERHPDLVLYLSPPYDEEDVDWASWIPEIVVEVVSQRSRKRDYIEKREEYLQFGVREYWIVDAQREEITFLRRSGGRWLEQKCGSSDTYQTKLLPGFKLNCGAILKAGQTPKRNRS